jgi:hypothetical protein
MSEKNFENLMKDAIEKIRTPNEEIILKNVRDGIENKKSFLKNFFVNFAKAGAVAIAVATFIFAAYFIPRNLNENLNGYEGGIAANPSEEIPFVIPEIPFEEITGELFPISNEFVIEMGVIREGLLGVANGFEFIDLQQRRVGMINLDGELVIPLEFSTIHGFSPEGFAYADKLNDDGSRQGFIIDTSGNIVLSEINGEPLDAWVNVYFGDGLATVQPRHDMETFSEPPSFIINMDGEIIMQDDNLWYQYIGNGLFLVSTTSFFISDPENPRERDAWVIDAQGRVVFDFLLVLFLDFEQRDLSVATYTTDSDMYSAWRYGLFCLRTNSFITDEIFTGRIPRFSNDRAIAQMLNDDYVIIDLAGNVLANLSEMYASPHMPNFSIWPSDLGGGFASLSFTRNGTIIINDSGELVAQTDFDLIQAFSDEGVAVFQQDMLFGYTDARGEIILPAEFDAATSIYNGVGFLHRDGQNYRFVLN